ncbi:unnamed protein product, partial [Gordionus sp. m RMFG-2023]
PNDTRPLAKFYWADQEMEEILKELGSFVGKKDPDRCSKVVREMRHKQCDILGHIEAMVRENFINTNVNDNACKKHQSPQNKSNDSDRLNTQSLISNPDFDGRLFRIKYPEELNMRPYLFLDNLINLTYEGESFNSNSNLLQDPIHDHNTILNDRTSSFEYSSIDSINTNSTSPNFNAGSTLYPGFIWFAAECLALGSLARLQRLEDIQHLVSLSKCLITTIQLLRKCLKTQALIDPSHYPETVKNALLIFDKIFAKFEFIYISNMVPVKTVKEYNFLQDVIVLFSETLEKAINKGYINLEQIEAYDPTIMFTLPRLSIINGLKMSPDGPLNLDENLGELAGMFKPFRNLLSRIKEFIEILSDEELKSLELKVSDNQQDSFADFSEKKEECIDRNNELMLKQSRVLLRSANGTRNNRKPIRIILCYNSRQKRGFSNLNNRSSRNHRGKEPDFLLDESFIKDGRRIDVNSKNTINSEIVTDNNNKTHVDIKSDNLKFVLRIGRRNQHKIRKVFKLHRDNRRLTKSMMNFMNQNEKMNKSQNGELSKSLSDYECVLKTRKEMLHMLFVCISGVADQLQTNFAPDFRYILKIVFDIHTKESNIDLPSHNNEKVGYVQSPSTSITFENIESDDIVHESSRNFPAENRNTAKFCQFPTGNNEISNIQQDLFDTLLPTFYIDESTQNRNFLIPQNQYICTDNNNQHDDATESGRIHKISDQKSKPPLWMPDYVCDSCHSCKSKFTILRRRHHCRNCGKIFCSKCSDNFISLPHYGINESVRTCLACYPDLKSSIIN